MRIRYPAYEMVAADRRAGGRGVRSARDRKKDLMPLSTSDERTALMAVDPQHGVLSGFPVLREIGATAEIQASRCVSQSGAA